MHTERPGWILRHDMARYCALRDPSVVWRVTISLSLEQTKHLEHFFCCDIILRSYADCWSVIRGMFLF